MKLFNLQWKEYKKLCIKILIFLIPAAIFTVVDISFAKDYFTYRIWEALLIESRTGRTLLPGSFYPNQTITKVEVGDLAAHTQYAVEKNVTWKTDSEGYRTDESSSSPDVVIIGDSTVIGTSMDQEDILSSQLSKILGVFIDGRGGSTLADYLASDSFKKHHPKVIIFTAMERGITDHNSPLLLHHSATSIIPDFVHSIVGRFHLSAITNPLGITIDRALKQNMYHDIRSTVDRFFSAVPHIMYGDPPIFFIQGDSANKPVSKDDMNFVVDKMTTAKDYLEKLGIKFVFLPVPNKETIYWQLLPSDTKPHFIPDLVERLSDNNIQTIDTEKIFLDRTEREGLMLYNTDDTHWNKTGVYEAAKAIAPIVKSDL